MNEKENNGTPSINKVIPIPSSGHFFRVWFEVLKPLHQLTDRECDVASEILRQMFILKRKGLDDDFINSILMKTQVRNKVKEITKVNNAYFQAILRKMREREILVKDDTGNYETIHQRYIPDLTSGEKTIGVLFLLNNPNDD